MEKISRKGFLKVAAAAAMSGVTAGALAACNSAASSSTAATGDAIYTAGTYTGTATGIGEVKVTMTFSETAITEVVIDASNETESIGGVAAPTLQEAIMAAQGTEIDNISGATVTTNAVKKAAASCIEQAMGVKADGADSSAAASENDWLGDRAGRSTRARSPRRWTWMWPWWAAASVRCCAARAQHRRGRRQEWPAFEKS